MPPRLAAFLAQLAAEKALKGTLIARGVAIRKIHDLVALQALPGCRSAANLAGDPGSAGNRNAEDAWDARASAAVCRTCPIHRSVGVPGFAR